MAVALKLPLSLSVITTACTYYITAGGKLDVGECQVTVDSVNEAPVTCGGRDVVT